MAKPRSPHYVEQRGAGYAVFWHNDLHSFHATKKQACIVLWRLKKLKEQTGAEPMPLSPLDQVVSEGRAEPRLREVSGIRCPDCEGYLQLRNGRFGLFYGCENYPKTLCRGSVSADRYGLPMGVPVNAITRRTRFMLRSALTWKGSPLVSASSRVLDMRDRFLPKVQTLSQEECQRVLGILFEAWPEMIEYVHTLPDHVQRTRLERAVSETDPLDDLLGPIGVDTSHEE